MVTLPCRILAEVEGLQEMLLLHTPPEQLASKALKARAASSDDLVAHALSMLASKSPIDVWESLQADHAKSHRRWPELCARCMYAAFEREVPVPFREWAETVMRHINTAAHMPPLTFRKLSLEAQLECVGEVELHEDEMAEVRRQAADTLRVAADEVADDAESFAEALEERKHRLKLQHAAARLLQARLPAYVKRGEDRAKRSAQRRQQLMWAAQCWGTCARAHLPAARAAARACVCERRARERRRADAEAQETGNPEPEQEAAEGEGAGTGESAEAQMDSLALDARQKALDVFRSISRAAQLASQCEGWLQVVNAAILAWNAMRGLCEDDEQLFVNAAGTAEWVCVPQAEPEAAPDGDAADGTEVVRDEARVAGNDDAGPLGRWTCSAAPENLPRLVRAGIEPLLELVGAMKSGDVVLATSVTPIADADQQKFAGFPAKRPRTPGAPESVAFEGSVLSLGSDKPTSRWFLEVKQLDFDQLTQVVLAAATALLAGGRPAAALDMGARWSALTDGTFDEHVIPLCLHAAPRAGADLQPFAAALAVVVRDKREALCALEALRHAARALGDTMALAATPSPCLKKARSVKPRATRKLSMARSRGASSMRSGHSSGTLAETRLMVCSPPTADPALHSAVALCGSMPLDVQNGSTSLR